MRLLQRLGLQRILLNKKDQRLASSIKMMVGRKPLNISLYRLALTPAGLGKENERGHKISNERLEFLGDAVLGSVVAEYLFQKYPLRDEGFLTETRSKLVNRESLNETGIKIGLRTILQDYLLEKPFTASKSLYGDMLEALVGAVYLDRGYAFTKNFILTRILLHFDIEGIISTTMNYKSKIVEWSQKENKEIDYKILEINGNQRYKEFVVALVVDSKEVATGKGPTKKKAEQEASKNACDTLQIPT